MNAPAGLSAWLAASALALALAACGGDDATSSSGAEEGSATGASTETARVGDTARSKGIVLTVNDAYVDESVSYTGGVESAETPDAEPRTVRAPRGGKYVFVETTVVNETDLLIDLTCSVPVGANVVGASGRRFEPISGIAQIAGNPPCSDLLEPGSEAEMTWVYAVPASARIATFEFADLTELLTASPAEPVAAPEPTVVALPELADGAARDN